MTNRKVAIIGSGLVGRSWAMIFAGANYNVYIYDIDHKQLERALDDIQEQLHNLEKEELLRGTRSASEQVLSVKVTTSLEEAVKDALFVQECVPEHVELKRKVLKEIDHHVNSKTIISTSTSSYLPSLLTDHLKNRANAIVSHPINPPYYVPLVEIIPAPWTHPDVALQTRRIMEDIGQTPVSLSREVKGFAVNRLQYALLSEAINLIKDGILDVNDLDKVMSEGLGMRYAFLGIFETTHLNAEGFKSYCERYSKIIHEIIDDFKPAPRLDVEVVENIAKQLEDITPLEKLPEKRSWRDRCITKLSILKKQLKKNQ